MRTALIVGDLHCGSLYAPFPAGFVTSYGSEYAPNIGQRYLNECWQDMAGKLPALDVIFANGDMIDGQQPKDEGRFLCEPDPVFQARAARILLAPILSKLKPSGVVLWREGTDYHEGRAAMHAEALAEWCGARPTAGRYAKAWEITDVDGVVLDVAHNAPGFERYRASALDKLLGFAAENADWLGGTDCIVRSHLHLDYWCVQHGLQVAVHCPAWELQTHYAQKSKAPMRMLSRWIGSVLLNIDAAWRERNQAAVQVVPLLYEHPRPGAERTGGAS